MHLFVSHSGWPTDWPTDRPAAPPEPPWSCKRNRDMICGVIADSKTDSGKTLTLVFGWWYWQVSKLGRVFFFFFKCCNWKVKCVYTHVYLNNIYSSEKLQRGVFNSLIISVQSWLCVSGISHYSREKKAVEWGRADLRMWWREWQRREKLGQGTRRD